jgi:hypothetical protein
MTKKTAVFGRVSNWKRCFFILVMAIKAEFFSLLLTLDLMESAMDLIVGERGGRLFRGVEEEYQNTAAEEDKQYITDQQFRLVC